MTDAQWHRIRELLPSPRGAPSKKGERNFVNAVLWIAKTGAPWRDLPRRFGKWKTIFNRFNNWAIAGKWEAIFKELSCTEEESVILDSSAVRAHQDSCGGKGGPKKTLSADPEVAEQPKFTLL
jgi:putative transposase